MNSPINADGAEIEDAGSTHHHIQSDKDVTVDLAKAPLSHHLREKNTITWQLIVTLNTALAVLFPDKAALCIYFLVRYWELLSVLCDSVCQAAAGLSPDSAAGSCDHVFNLPVQNKFPQEPQEIALGKFGDKLFFRGNAASYSVCILGSLNQHLL